MRLGALILTGGASRRMGADKASLDWDGRSAVARVAELARAVGADGLLTVGPGDHGLPRVSEEPPGGGPVAGIVAGAARLRADRVLVLAVDAPTVTAADLASLLSAPAPGAAFAGLHLPLVVWPQALPADAGAGWAMGRLVEAMGLATLEPPPDAIPRLRGANTPQERATLLAAQKRGAR